MRVAKQERTEHKWCRRGEAKLAKRAAAICSRYYKYLSHSVKRKPPECAKSAFNTDDDKKAIGSCLELTKAWLDPLYEEYIKCKKANQKKENRKKDVIKSRQNLKEASVQPPPWLAWLVMLKNHAGR